MAVRQYSRVFAQYARLHLKTAIEYRAAFWSQTIFMFFNDVLFVLTLFFLFGALGELNGYGFRTAAIIFAFAALSVGWFSLFFSGAEKLFDSIIDKKFDFFLLLPIDEVFHSAISKTSYDAVGDIVLGIVMFLWLIPEHFFLAVALSFVGTIIIGSFHVLFNSLAFYLERPRQLVRSLSRFVIAGGSWPADAFSQPARLFLYFSTMAFITMVPYHLVEMFNWSVLAKLLFVAGFVFFTSFVIFKASLRRYESGNVFAARG